LADSGAFEKIFRCKSLMDRAASAGKGRKGAVVKTHPIPSRKKVDIILCRYVSTQHASEENGKEHRYWSIVENKRVARGRVVQRHVLYLGEISGSPQDAWQKTIEIFRGRTAAAENRGGVAPGGGPRRDRRRGGGGGAHPAGGAGAAPAAPVGRLPFRQAQGPEPAEGLAGLPAL
jgi:hypothetical protein